MSVAPARVAAYEILRRVSNGASDLPSAVASVRDRLEDERDRALATDIATGTVRWRAALDHLAAHFARRPAARLDPEVLDVLRLSVYQLLHLTRVPASAVVDDAVDLVKRAGKRSASGLVNAVLRSVSRQRRDLPLPPRPAKGAPREQLLAYLSVTLSHPRWLAERWLDRAGFERAEAWMTFDNTAPVLTLRANPIRTTRERLIGSLRNRGVQAERTRYAPDGVHVPGGSVHDVVAAGDAVIQDEASQLVAALAGSSPGPLVLDTCASPGGKTTAIAAALGPGERIIACDVRDRRVSLLRRTVQTTGVSNVRLVQADLTEPVPFKAAFSTVIVDAPCSGLGTLRRDPDIRWRRHEADLPSLAAVEQQMLEYASAAVAPGGRLVYATCSSEPDENEAVAAAFSARHPEFTPVRASRANAAIASELEDDQGCLRTAPDRHGLELFFGAVFERVRQL
jgi:16S rRNA (cytosine967-C5)-methyltransferase